MCCVPAPISHFGFSGSAAASLRKLGRVSEVKIGQKLIAAPSAGPLWIIAINTGEVFDEFGPELRHRTLIAELNCCRMQLVVWLVAQIHRSGRAQPPETLPSKPAICVIATMGRTDDPKIRAANDLTTS